MISVFGTQTGDAVLPFTPNGTMLSGANLQGGQATPGSVRSCGNVSVQVSAAGLGNGADTTDDVLFTYALPANSLDAAGRQLTITAAGKFAANTNNKRIKIWFGTTTQSIGAAVVGGTLIADSGVVATSGGGWSASVQVQKYGANGSNTQIATCAQMAAGTVHLGTSSPVTTTAVENGAINITITGSSSTTGAANDVVGQLFDIAFNN
jgi:hypothetical protein